MLVLLSLAGVAALVVTAVLLVKVARQEIAEDFRRRRMAAEAATATARLRQIERHAQREMHAATQLFMDDVTEKP